MIFQPGVGGSGGGLSVVDSYSTTSRSQNKSYDIQPKLLVVTMQKGGLSGINELMFTLFATPDSPATTTIDSETFSVSISGKSTRVSYNGRLDRMWILVLG